MTVLAYLDLPFAQHALLAATIVAISCGLIGPFVVNRGMAFAVHGTSELAFTGAAAALLLGINPLYGALVGSVIVALGIGLLGARERERDATIGILLAFGLGLGVLLLSFYQGFASAATSILFGNIFGVSQTQLITLLWLGILSSIAVATMYHPLLFASVDPEVAKARGVPVTQLGLIFLVILAITVTSAAQVVGTLLVLSLAITPAAAAQRLSVKPSTVTWLSIGFALLAADGGILLSLGSGTLKPSVGVAGLSFLIYVVARLVGHIVRDQRSERDQPYRSLLHRLLGLEPTETEPPANIHDHQPPDRTY